MHTNTIRELHQLLLNKHVSAIEVTQYFLERIEHYNPMINGFISVNTEAALQTAQQAQALIDKGKAHVLTGIPVAHKDLFCAQGEKTSCASKMLDNFTAPYQATMVEKLNACFMPSLGKTNMDEFAMGSSNKTSYYGQANNPWDISRVPGGSSGGAAAAVAAGLAPVATGSDTGGSIRQPAAFCGVTGIKPTYGSISRYGMVAFASSLDQAGPLTRSAEDAAIVLEAMVGQDPKDATSVAHPKPQFVSRLEHSIQGIKVGLPKPYFTAQLDSTIADKLHQVAKQLEKLGATIVEIDLAHTELAVPCYYIIAPAEASSNLSRYDGVRFGYRAANPDSLEDLYLRTRSEGFGDEVKRRILVGTYVLSSGYYDAYYRKAQKVRRLIKTSFNQALAEVDVLLTPTAPSIAFKHNQINTDDPVQMYLADLYTIAVNLAGLPALSMPCGFEDGMPVGAQLIGNYFDESLLLNIAHQYQCHTDFHLQQPVLAEGEIA